MSAAGIVQFGRDSWFNLFVRLRAYLLEAAVAFVPANSLVLASLLLAGAAMVYATAKVWVSFGTVPSLTMAIVFFFPLVLGGVGGLRALSRLDRATSGARAKEREALQLANRRQPADPATLRRFEDAERDVHADGSKTVAALVIGRVLLACAEGRYEPVASILALDLPAIRSGTFAIKTWQLTAIRLGILTTFIGLMLGLSEILPLLHGAAAPGLGRSNTEAIGHLVQQMTLAFGGSVAGLVAATVLQIEAGLLAARENTFLKQLEGAILAVQTFYFNASSKEPLIRSMEGLGEGIRSFDRSLDDARLEIGQAAEGLIAAVGNQNTALQIRIDALAQGRDVFADLIQGQDSAIRGVAASLQQTCAQVTAEMRSWIDQQVRASVATTTREGIDRAINEGKSILLEHATTLETAFTSQVGRILDDSKDVAREHLAVLQRTVREIGSSGAERGQQAQSTLEALLTTANATLAQLEVVDRGRRTAVRITLACASCSLIAAAGFAVFLALTGRLLFRWG